MLMDNDGRESWLNFERKYTWYKSLSEINNKHQNQ